MDERTRQAVNDALADIAEKVCFDAGLRPSPRPRTSYGMRHIGWLRLTVHRAPGWFGVRRGSRCVYLRDVRRHSLRFSERNGYRRRIASVGPWELWT